MPRRFIAVLCLLVAAALASAGPSLAGSTVSPDQFRSLSTGVALIDTYGCVGQPLALGSGFLVGRSIVMTAKHVLAGACRIKTVVGGRQYSSSHWNYWAGTDKSENADLATYKLDRSASGHIFRFRTSSPLAGTNLAMIGHPLGNAISLNQGPVIRRFINAGIPLLEVRMLGAKGASGSPFVDNTGRVAGVLQLGLGTGETSGYLFGIDLPIWWGGSITKDLCRAYPSGGIAGCGGNSTSDVSAPTKPKTKPPTTTPPTYTPPPLSVASCWATNADSFDPANKAFLLPPAAQMPVYVVAQFNRATLSSDSSSIRYQLFRPDGTQYGEGTYSVGGSVYTAYRVQFTLSGSLTGLAPVGGVWTAQVTMGSSAACSYRFQVDKLADPFQFAVSPTAYDPSSAIDLRVDWRLLQELSTLPSLVFRLIGPSGVTLASAYPYLSTYSASGYELLFLPYCYRSSYFNSDSCTYGTYHVQLVDLFSGAVYGQTDVVAVKP